MWAADGALETSMRIQLIIIGCIFTRSLGKILVTIVFDKVFVFDCDAIGEHLVLWDAGRALQAGYALP